MSRLRAGLLSALVFSLGCGGPEATDEPRESGYLRGAGGASPSGCSGSSCDPKPTPTQLSAGGAHACALVAGAGLQCWGNNDYGQLGNDSQTDGHVPVPVSGLSSGAVAVSAGDGHTCALTAAGAALCWGDNYSGALGNESITTETHVPVPVTGLSSGIVALSAGDGFTCALTSAGGLLCWGENGDGQLGNGSPLGSKVPVPVAGLASGVRSVSSGFWHTCAVTSAGAAQCWGENEYGQLGIGSTTNSAVPVTVAGLSSGVVAVSAGGDHTCALTSAGAVVCWGLNYLGQLGDGSTTDSAVPVKVAGLPSSAVAISARGSHTCAVLAGGEIACWGDNGNGQLGNGATTPSAVPVPVLGVSSAIAVSAGGGYTCALTSTGAVVCWGDNGNGQLGNESTVGSLVPVEVVGY